MSNSPLLFKTHTLWCSRPLVRPLEACNPTCARHGKTTAPSAHATHGPAREMAVLMHLPMCFSLELHMCRGLWALQGPSSKQTAPAQIMSSQTAAGRPAGERRGAAASKCPVPRPCTVSQITRACCRRVPLSYQRAKRVPPTHRRHISAAPFYWKALNMQQTNLGRSSSGWMLHKSASPREALGVF